MATDIARAEESTAVAKVPTQMGVAPKTIDEAWRLSQMLARSELVPKNFRNKPEDIMVAIQMGLELGFPPMQSLASIAVINGRASVWGDGFLALIMCSPLYADHDEFYMVGGQRLDGLVPDDLKADTTAAVCTFWRVGKTAPVTRHFTIAQAKKANLLGKQGPWQEYPDRMMAMRARGFAGRDAFPDLLRGIRTAEEVRDTPQRELDDPLTVTVQMPQRTSERPPVDVSSSPEPRAQSPEPQPPAAQPVAEAPQQVAVSEQGPEPEAAPQPEPLPDGADRFVDVAKRTTTSNKSWWEAATERGIRCYTWSTTIGPQLEEFKITGALVQMTTTQDSRGQHKIDTLGPFAQAERVPGEDG